MEKDSKSPTNCLFIIGMHRSGTSALAGLLSNLGLDIGEKILSPNIESNPKGFFENEKVIALNEKILLQLDKTWDHELLTPPLDLSKLKFKELKLEIITLLQSEFTKQTNYILIKEPRLSLLLNIWIRIFEELNISFSFVLVMRNPLEVAKSLLKRNSFSFQKSMSLWLNYNLSAEKYSRNYNRVIINFVDLINDPKKIIKQINNTLDLKINLSDDDFKNIINGFIDPKLKHHNINTTSDSDCPLLITKVYDHFLRLIEERQFKESDGPILDGFLEEYKKETDLYYFEEVVTKLSPSTQIEHYYAQLFVDTGEGFNEYQSKLIYISKSTNQLSFGLNEFNDIKKIRLDPSNCPVFIELNSVKIQGGNGEQIPIKFKSNAILIKEDTFLFDTFDPHIVFEFENDIRKKSNNIFISIKYIALGKDTIPFLSEQIDNLRKIIKEKNTSIHEQLQLIKKRRIDLDKKDERILSQKEAEKKIQIEKNKTEESLNLHKQKIKEAIHELTEAKTLNTTITNQINHFENQIKQKDILIKDMDADFNRKLDLNETLLEETKTAFNNKLESKELFIEKIKTEIEQKIEEKNNLINEFEASIQKELELKAQLIKEQTKLNKKIEQNELLIEQVKLKHQQSIIRNKEKTIEALKKVEKKKINLEKALTEKISVLLQEKNSLKETIKTKERYNEEIKFNNKLIENSLKEKQEELELLQNKKWFSFSGKKPSGENSSALKAQILFSLFTQALKHPVQTLKHFSPKKLRVLKEAIGKENPADILGNYKKLVKNDAELKSNHVEYSTDMDKLVLNDEAYHFNIEKCEFNDNQLTLAGWLLHRKEILKVELFNNTKLICLVSLDKERTDVQNLYSDFTNNLLCGFEIVNLKVESSTDSLFLRLGIKGEEDIDLTLNPISNQFNENEIQITESNFLEEYQYFQKPHPEYFVDFENKNNTNVTINQLKYIAFYLPQFHQIPENDEWWGKGFTEWTNVTQAVPRFKGHFQPRQPSDLGFYDLSKVENIKKQVELAINYGVFGFCFHYYWFSRRRLLEKPLDLFLESDIDFNFCLCWANENWTRRWDGLEEDILLAQKFSKEDPTHFVEDIMPYLSDERYIKINGRHLLIVYRPGIIPNIKSTVDEWRKLFKEKGIDPLFACVQGFGLTDPRSVGFDIAIEFPPHKIAIDLPLINNQLKFYDAKFTGNIHNYSELVERAKHEATTSFPLIRGVFPSWDNEARRKGKGTTSFSFSTPDKYKKWLNIASTYAKENPVEGENIVFINAWNEWAEGAVLEPDRHFGYAYLEATHQVLHNIKDDANKINVNDKYKCILVSHDAHKHGAQVLVYNIGKLLKENFGIEIVFLLLGDGQMVEEFKEISRTYLLDSSNEVQIISDLKAEGFHNVLLNTTVSGKLITKLKVTGFNCFNLIHELPELIKEYKLESTCLDIYEHADKIIFPSKIVQEGFNRVINKKASGREVVRPQGIFNFDINKVDEIKEGQLRKYLKLKNNEFIIGGIGFGDERKGIDLFVELAKYVTEKENSHFVWIGPIKETLKTELYKYIKQNKITKNIHFIPYQDDLKSFSFDFDVFVLTSREDPFPSVILESLALHVPVVAFENAGGFVDLNNEEEILVLAQYGSVSDMGNKIIDLLKDKNKYKAIAQKGRNKVLRDFQFNNYCFDLINYKNDFKKISVIVPNYNYADVLEERLLSIWNQHYPIYEVIVLDDKSSDDSVDKIKYLAKKYNRKIEFIINEQNSGSVFLQWQKGINLAKGDFIWIAEADDSAELSFLSTLISFFDFSSVGMAYCQSKQIDENNKHLANDYHYYTDELDKNKWHKDYSMNGKDEIISGLSIRNTIMNVSSILFRTTAIKETINTNIDWVRKNFKVAGDWFLYIKLLENYHIAYSSKSLNIHRRHSKSATSTNKHLEEVKTIHNYIKKNLNVNADVDLEMQNEISKLKTHYT